MRARGFDVKTYSVRQAGQEHNVDKEVIAEREGTHYLLPAKLLSLFAANCKYIFSTPASYFRMLRLAWATKRPGVKGFLLQMAYWQEAILLCRQIQRDELAHLHNHLGDNSGTVTMLAAGLARIPFSVSIHGPHIFFDALYWALDEKTRRAAFISCIGHYCKSQMMLYSRKEDWKKLTIVRCGVDLSLLQYREPQRKAKQFLYVGRLSAEKGVPVLFDSVSSLVEQGEELELLLLGDGEDRKYLERLAREKGVERYVTFGGFVDQQAIKQALRDTDVFVLPSFAEGIPVALMEAMAVGVPVIATHVGGVVELVVDGVTGQLVSASDSASLANAMQRYMHDEELCRRIAQEARAKVEKEFNIDDQVDKLANLLRFSQ